MALLCDKCGSKLKGKNNVCSKCGTIKLVYCKCGRQIEDTRYTECSLCRSNVKARGFSRSIAELKLVLVNSVKIFSQMFRR